MLLPARAVRDHQRLHASGHVILVAAAPGKYPPDLRKLRYDLVVTQNLVCTCRQKQQDQYDQGQKQRSAHSGYGSVMPLLHRLIRKIQRVRDFPYRHAVIIFHTDDLHLVGS